MNMTKISMGISILCLLAVLMMAGCTSQSADTSQASASGAPVSSVSTIQTMASSPQPSYTTPASQADNQNSGDFSYSADDAPSPDQGQVTMAPDTPAVPSGTVPQQTLTTDHEDMGDILP